VWTNTFTRVSVPVGVSTLSFTITSGVDIGNVYVATNIAVVPNTDEVAGPGNDVTILLTV
jgi:hypothetical protein